MFSLSARSLDNMRGVNPNLQAVVRRAIKLTKIDFGVIEGVRTLERQQELFDSKASQTMRSKHLANEDGYGRAVDLMAYVNGRGCWELNVYDDIADAMKEAAIEAQVAIRWGCAWHIDNICDFDGTMEKAMNDYIDSRRASNRRPFLDGPHFELSE
jgi:peptidoglycan L-alanyl-D-glutamate endopeptidase CwlK